MWLSASLSDGSHDYYCKTVCETSDTYKARPVAEQSLFWAISTISRASLVIIVKYTCVWNPCSGNGRDLKALNASSSYLLISNVSWKSKHQGTPSSIQDDDGALVIASCCSCKGKFEDLHFRIQPMSAMQSYACFIWLAGCSCQCDRMHAGATPNIMHTTISLHCCVQRSTIS